MILLIFAIVIALVIFSLLRVLALPLIGVIAIGWLITQFDGRSMPPATQPQYQTPVQPSDARAPLAVPVVADTTPAVSPFAAGLRDRGYWEAWVAQLDGSYRDGVLYWAGERSKRNARPCRRAATGTPPDWLNGCQDAAARLRAFDVNRLSDQVYRAGWNSWNAAPQAPAPQEKEPVAEPQMPDAVQAPLPVATNYTAADIPRLNRMFDQDPDAFGASVTGIASFSAAGSFLSFEQFPAQPGLWIVSVRVPPLGSATAICSYTTYQPELASMQPGSAVVVSGLVAIPTKDGIGLAHDCSVTRR